MNHEIIYSDATKLADLIRRRELSPVEVVRAHVDRIDAIDPKVNAIVTLAESALAAAKMAEASVLAGDQCGFRCIPPTPTDLKPPTVLR